MSAFKALHAAKAAGIEVAVDGDALSLKAPSPPPEHVLAGLSRNKAEIIALLRPRDENWSSEDWQAIYDERAGVAEFDGGLPRAEAEARAFGSCVVEWLNRNFECSPSGSCLACGGGDKANDPLLPHGGAPAGHVWLHSGCWPAWHAARRADAVNALLAIGIRGRIEEK